MILINLSHFCGIDTLYWKKVCLRYIMSRHGSEHNAQTRGSRHNAAEIRRSQTRQSREQNQGLNNNVRNNIIIYNTLALLHARRGRIY